VSEKIHELAHELDRWIVRHYGVPEHYTSAREIAATIAAAEERGRRAGIEERDELRTLLTEARRYLAVVFYSPPSAQRKANTLLDRVDAALAPRDSGKDG
jgi:hypothetical protein